MNSVKLEEKKIDIQNSMAFLYTNHKLSEREIKKTVSFKIASKGIKYFRINVIKKAKDLYTENYKILIKETEKDINDRKIFHAHELEELILLKCSYYPNQSIDSMQFLLKYQWHISWN